MKKYEDIIKDLEDQQNERNEKLEKSLPIIPLRDQLLLPFVIFPVVAGRQGTIDAINTSLDKHGSRIFAVPQIEDNGSENYPKAGELHRVGTICVINQVFKMPDGSLRVILQGVKKARAKKYIKQKSYYQANLQSYPYKTEIASMEFQGLINVFMNTLDEYLAKDRGITIDLIKSIKTFKNPYEIYHFTLANLEIPLKDKIKYFEIDDLEEGFNELIGFLAEQIEVMRIQNDLEMKVKRQISKSQKEYFLNEQLRIIHKELGYDDDEKDNLASIKMRLNELDLPKEVRKKADDEFKKLSKLSPSMPEHFVVYNYLTWILDLPWAKPVYKDFDIKDAAAILDRDHYGLEKVKDRILEYLAVLKISDKIKGQIICLVGPPGVGKTSIGRSIAESLDREFIRISLGGVRDESEIRGHRRTYIGAIPGVIMQSMKKAGTTNPLIMLDEIDKMSMDFKGDPASALLEVLDPEQNKSFRDHFLDFGYDLSNVLFITTANSLSSIPRPLYDRMEIISMPGYTEIEKREIAMRHLIKKKLDEFNIEDKIKINISEQIITQIINKYTRESGVRELERKIGTILRKIVKKYVGNEIKKSYTVKLKDLKEFLGYEPYLLSDIPQKDTLGVAVGLAWTPVGGDILLLEALKLPGSGKITITGKIGQVMQESAKAAYSYAVSQCEKFGIYKNYKKVDLHLHIPEGAVPKDGPSAGIGLACIIISVLSDRPIYHHIAMTGEITLTGRVLAIGGLQEKLMAAKQAKIKKVIVPAANRPELEEIKEEIKEGLELIFVDNVDEVINLCLHPKKKRTNENKTSKKSSQSRSDK